MESLKNRLDKESGRKKVCRLCRIKDSLGERTQIKVIGEGETKSYVLKGNYLR